MPTADILLDGERLNVFPLRGGIRQGCELTTPIQTCQEVLASGIRQGKEKE